MIYKAIKEAITFCDKCSLMTSEAKGKVKNEAKNPKTKVKRLKYYFPNNWFKDYQ